MKIKLIVTAACLASGAALRATTLSESTAVQSQPDPLSAVIVVLKAGAEMPPASDKVGPPPAGWTAVDVAGPFEGYVRNKDLTKQLDVMPGATVYAAPKDAAGAITVFAKGDKAEITGLHGSWTQIRLDKTLVGYIQTEPSAAPVTAAPVAASAPAPSAPAAAPSAPSAPAPAVQASPGGSESLSRIFEGTFASSKSLLYPKRPYDWQLNDPAGKRIAYIDLNKLLLTDQIENYAGHSVMVLGALKQADDPKDIVIVAEALRLK
jgi:hypothetical protein